MEKFAVTEDVARTAYDADLNEHMGTYNRHTRRLIDRTPPTASHQSACDALTVSEALTTERHEMETHDERVTYVNAHREACDREPFVALTGEELERHEALIELHAPYGNDPWHEEGRAIILNFTNEELEAIVNALEILSPDSEEGMAARDEALMKVVVEMDHRGMRKGGVEEENSQ